MHFVVLLTVLTAFTSTTSAGTLRDRRRETLMQQMRRNNASEPASSELSVPGSLIATTDPLEGLNSTIGLTPTGVIGTSELLATSETTSIEATACPSALTVTVTHTQIFISTVQACETKTSDESTHIATTDPAQVATEQPVVATTATGTQRFSSTEIVIPGPDESALIEQPVLEQPTPLKEGAVTTQIITQTISSPAATLVSEFVTCRGRGRNQRCKVTSITETQEESVGIETVTLVVTQSEEINLVTKESGVGDTPTATVVDGIARETAAPAPSVPHGEENAVERPAFVTNENAVAGSSTSCADAIVTPTSIVTVDGSASSSAAASETTASILPTQNLVKGNTLSTESTALSPSITRSAVTPDASENIVTGSMVTIITMTRSVVPIEVTFGTGATQETAIVTPEPETVLSTITLGYEGITGTDMNTARPTSGSGNKMGKGKLKKSKQKVKDGKKKEHEIGNGNGNGNADENGGKGNREQKGKNDKSPGRNQNSHYKRRNEN